MGYDLVRALFADRRVSHDTSNPAFPHESPGFQARSGQEQTFVDMDDPGHARLRRMVTSPFTARQVEKMRETIEAQVGDLVTAMVDGPKPADLVESLALPLPSLTIASLLGVPEEAQAFFQRVASTLMRRGSSIEEVQEAQGQLLDYLVSLIEDKRGNPGDDLLSGLAAQVNSGALTSQEAAGTARLLLAAGHDTTSGMISLGTVALLKDPEHWRELGQTDDPEVVVRTVEELLRYLSIVHIGSRRFATEDIEIGDETIRAGDSIALSIDLANRDQNVFQDPGKFDVHRDARRHLSFGFGVHQCLGQSLARLELQIVFATLARRIPTLRVTSDIESLAYKRDAIVYGLESLDVTW